MIRNTELLGSRYPWTNNFFPLADFPLPIGVTFALRRQSSKNPRNVALTVDSICPSAKGTGKESSRIRRVEGSRNDALSR
jgi:hypothetical protein